MLNNTLTVASYADYLWTQAVDKGVGALPLYLSTNFTYLRFHTVFILPLIILLFVTCYLFARINTIRVYGLLVYCAVSFVSATPWDIYLVHRGVWGYQPDSVIGSVYGVPLEEYAFFLLQPLLTGLILYALESPIAALAPKKKKGAVIPSSARKAVRVVTGLAMLCAAVYAGVALQEEKMLYVKLILAYYLPFIASQCFMAGDELLEDILTGGVVPLTIALSTLYLWFVDSIAIRLGSWRISKTHTSGYHPFTGLPLEEALFFLVTNVLLTNALYLWQRLFALPPQVVNTPAQRALRANKKVIVVGGGLGGLATAARLAHAGYKVEVLEKNEHVGGRCDYIDRDGHRFDTGPSIMLMPQVFSETYSALGEDMFKMLNLRRCDPIYNIYFENGQILQTFNDLGKMKGELEKIEPGCFGNFLRYLQEGHQHFYGSIEHVVGRNFRTIFEYFDPRKLGMIFSLRPLVKHYGYVSDFFKNNNIRAAFTFQNMYLGISPYDAPATYSLLQYTEFADGVWYPLGGMYKIAESLRVLGERNGVKFTCKAEVKEVKKEAVVLKNGQEMKADLIVCNADLPYAYNHLLPASKEATRVDNLRYTSSALMFYWAVDKIFPQLGHHNIFLNGDYKESFDSIFRSHEVPEFPSFYINAPQRTDPSAAPPGQDSLMVLVPVGYLDEKNSNPEFWKKKLDEVREYIFKKLERVGVKDLRSHIKWEVTRTPLEWRDLYNLSKGNTFGLSHDFWQVGWFRPANKHANIDNLYFTGASTHPGSGMPLVLLSAKLTAERIMENENLAGK